MRSRLASSPGSWGRDEVRIYLKRQLVKLSWQFREVIGGDSLAVAIVREVDVSGLTGHSAGEHSAPGVNLTVHVPRVAIQLVLLNTSHCMGGGE